MKLAAQTMAAFEMAREVGIRPTAERIRNFAYARLVERRRAAQFRRMNLSEPVVSDILGQRMLLDPNSPGLDRDLLLDGIREPIATGHIMRILRPDDVVLEVGANVGYYALIEARLCRKIYAAEPHPENFRRLNENIALNDLTISRPSTSLLDRRTPLYICSARIIRIGIPAVAPRPTMPAPSRFPATGSTVSWPTRSRRAS